MFSRRLFLTKMGLLAGASASGCGDGSPFYPYRPKNPAQPDLGKSAAPPDLTAAANPDMIQASSCGGRTVQDQAENLQENQAFLTSYGDPTRATYIVRDSKGLMAISINCTHKGCYVKFNETDLTFDCPCHGSRFHIDGSVLNGPAPTPLLHRPLCRAPDGTLSVDYAGTLPTIDERLPP